MNQYEYKVLTLDFQNLEANLNLWAKEGFQLKHMDIKSALSDHPVTVVLEKALPRAR